MALSDYQQLVDNLVRAPSDTTSVGDRDRAIGLAVARYSADAPRRLLAEVIWVEAGHLGPLPEAWLDGCYLVGAEHPIGQQPPAPLDLTIYHGLDGLVLAAAEPLAAGSVVLVRLAAPHLLAGDPDDVDTIPVQHREAVASYAAHVLCKQLAAMYSSDVDASVGADHSNTESRARNFAARARDYRGAYYAGIGRLDPQANATANSPSAGLAPAVSVSAWSGRTRMRSDLGGEL